MSGENVAARVFRFRSSPGPVVFRVSHFASCIPSRRKRRTSTARRSCRPTAVVGVETRLSTAMCVAPQVTRHPVRLHDIERAFAFPPEIYTVTSISDRETLEHLSQSPESRSANGCK